MGIASIVTTTSGREKLQGNHSLATETISKVDAKLEKKVQKYKINELESDNIKNVTLNDRTQPGQLCLSVDTKIGLAQKDIT